jgi:hypothetical protein
MAQRVGWPTGRRAQRVGLPAEPPPVPVLVQALQESKAVVVRLRRSLEEAESAASGGGEAMPSWSDLEEVSRQRDEYLVENEALHAQSRVVESRYNELSALHSANVKERRDARDQDKASAQDRFGKMRKENRNLEIAELRLRASECTLKAQRLEMCSLGEEVAGLRVRLAIKHPGISSEDECIEMMQGHTARMCEMTASTTSLQEKFDNLAAMNRVDVSGSAAVWQSDDASQRSGVDSQEELWRRNHPVPWQQPASGRLLTYGKGK